MPASSVGGASTPADAGASTPTSKPTAPTPSGGTPQQASPEPRPRARQQRKADGFGGPALPGGGRLVGAEAREPVRPVRELIPSRLASLPTSEAVARRFAGDFALLDGQLRPRTLPASERAARAWSFFMAYAEAAAARGPHPKTLETFLQALKEQGLASYRDADSGRDMLALARWVLSAPTPREAQERGASVHLEPPPEVLLSEEADVPRPPSTHPETPAPRAHRELRDSAFTATPERPALERAEERGGFHPPSAVPPGGSPLPPPTPPLSREPRSAAEERGAGSRLSGTDKRLGSHMLWNVLHRFRADPEDSAEAQAEYNRLIFGAVLALVGLGLAGVVFLAL